MPSSGGCLLTNGLTRGGGCCRRQFIICWSAQHNVRSFRPRQKAPSGDIVSKPVFSGAMISQPRSSHGFAARVSPSATWTTYLSTCLNVWAWLCRPLSYCLSTPIDRQRREIAFLLQEDKESAVHSVRRCLGGLHPHSGVPMRLLGVLEVSSNIVFRGDACARYPQRCCRRYLSLESRLRSRQFARRSSQHPVAGSGTGDHRHFPLYFGVSLGLMPHAVAAPTERTYSGHCGAWIDF